MAFLHHVIAHAPFIIRAIRTDCGREWSTRFSIACTLAGIKHIRNESYHPDHNGKIEKFHDGLKYRCFYVYLHPSDCSAQHLSANIFSRMFGWEPEQREDCSGFSAFFGRCERPAATRSAAPRPERSSGVRSRPAPTGSRSQRAPATQHGAPVGMRPDAEVIIEEARSVTPPLFPEDIPSQTLGRTVPSFEEFCNDHAGLPVCGILQRDRDEGDWRIPPGFIPTGLPMARPGGFMPMGQMPPVPWNEEFLRMSITQSPAVPQRFPSAGYSAPTSQGQVPFFVPMGAMAPVLVPVLPEGQTDEGSARQGGHQGDGSKGEEGSKKGNEDADTQEYEEFHDAYDYEELDSAYEYGELQDPYEYGE